MKKLSKTHLAERVRLIAALKEAKAELEKTIDKFNLDMRYAFDAVEKQQSSYNDLVEEANNFVGLIRSEMDDYSSERSERWAESEAGQAFDAWRNEFEVELEGEDLTCPDELETSDLNGDAILEELPEAPE